MVDLVASSSGAMVVGVILLTLFRWVENSAGVKLIFYNEATNEAYHAIKEIYVSTEETSMAADVLKGYSSRIL